MTKKKMFSPGLAVVYAILIMWAITTIYPIDRKSVV